MTARAPRPCRSPACAKLCRDGSGFCETHKQQASGWNRPGRGNSDTRGYGHKWRKLRDAVFKRDKGLCQLCLQEGRYTPGNQVDHRIPKSRGGTDSMENCWALCEPHHKAKSQAESRGEDYLVKGCDVNGIPRDPSHHWRRGRDKVFQ